MAIPRGFSVRQAPHTGALAFVNTSVIFAAAIATFLLLIIGVREAAGTTIGVLVATKGSLTQDNLLFADFTFDANAFGDFSPADLNDIDVQGVSIGGNPGLRITGPSSVAANEGALSALGYELTFTVSALDGALVHDFHQHFDAGVTGAEAIAQVNGQAFTNDASGSFLAGIGIGIHEGDPSTSDVAETLQQDVSSLLFQHFLLVQTSGGGFFPFPAGSAAIPFTDLTFSEVPPSPVPEPNTLGLVVVGVLVVRRYCRKHPAR